MDVCRSCFDKPRCNQINPLFSQRPFTCVFAIVSLYLCICMCKSVFVHLYLSIPSFVDLSRCNQINPLFSQRPFICVFAIVFLQLCICILKSVFVYLYLSSPSFVDLFLTNPDAIRSTLCFRRDRLCFAILGAIEKPVPHRNNKLTFEYNKPSLQWEGPTQS